jgi:hypothetical protein
MKLKSQFDLLPAEFVSPTSPLPLSDGGSDAEDGGSALEVAWCFPTLRPDHCRVLQEALTARRGFILLMKSRPVILSPREEMEFEARAGEIEVEWLDAARRVRGLLKTIQFSAEQREYINEELLLDPVAEMSLVLAAM